MLTPAIQPSTRGRREREKQRVRRREGTTTRESGARLRRALLTRGDGLRAEARVQHREVGRRPPVGGHARAIARLLEEADCLLRRRLCGRRAVVVGAQALLARLLRLPVAPDSRRGRLRPHLCIQNVLNCGERRRALCCPTSSLTQILSDDIRFIIGYPPHCFFVGRSRAADHGARPLAHSNSRDGQTQATIYIFPAVTRR